MTKNVYCACDCKTEDSVELLSSEVTQPCNSPNCQRYAATCPNFVVRTNLSGLRHSDQPVRPLSFGQTRPYPINRAGIISYSIDRLEKGYFLKKVCHDTVLTHFLGQCFWWAVPILHLKCLNFF